MKQCSKCGLKKNINDFKADRRKSDGKAKRCKTCTAAANVAWRKQNPGYEKRPPFRSVKRTAAWAQRQREASSNWRKKYPDRHRAADRKWRKANPEQAKAIKATRRARKKGVGGSHTGQQIKDLLDRQKGKCASCRASIRRKYHIDHINPIARGGSNNICNIQLLCPKCNLSKRSKDPLVWARENGRLL